MDASPKFWVDSTRLDQLDLVRPANRYSFKMIDVLRFRIAANAILPFDFPRIQYAYQSRTFFFSPLFSFCGCGGYFTSYCVASHKGVLSNGGRCKKRRRKGGTKATFKRKGGEGLREFDETNQIQWERYGRLQLKMQ